MEGAKTVRRTFATGTTSWFVDQGKMDKEGSVSPREERKAKERPLASQHPEGLQVDHLHGKY